MALINNNFLYKHPGMYPGGGCVFIPPGPGPAPAPTPVPLYGVVTPGPTPGPTPVPLYGVVRALYAVPAPVEYQQLDH